MTPRPSRRHPPARPRPTAGSAHPAMVVAMAMLAGLAVIAVASGQGLVTGWVRVPEERVGTLRTLGTALTLVALVALAWVRARSGTAGQAARAPGEGARAGVLAGEDDPDQQAAESHREDVPLRRHFAMAAKVAVVLVLIALLTPPAPGPDQDPRDGIAGATPDLSSDRPPRLPPRPREADTLPPPSPEDAASPFALPLMGPESPGTDADARSGPGLSSLAGDAIVVLLVVAGTIIAVMVALSRLQPPPEEDEEAEEPEEEGLRMPWLFAHEGLAAPGTPPPAAWGTPRTAVGRAYHELLDVFARRGAPRRFEEGPHEHLRRVLPAVASDFAPRSVPGVPDPRAPFHDLARLHVAVEFGQVEATPEREAEARRLLDRCRAELDGAGVAP